MSYNDTKRGRISMFKVIKALNNNAVIAKDVKSDNELIILEKGIGFGKKKR